jgi:hypothetical protein
MSNSKKGQLTNHESCCNIFKQLVKILLGFWPYLHSIALIFYSIISLSHSIFDTILSFISVRNIPLHHPLP